MKPKRKVTTSEASILAAELALDIQYPQIIRNKMLLTNGFHTGVYRFYCVKDVDDLYHTSDDVLRENNNPNSGWKLYLPKGFAAIADDEGNGCLALSNSKDGKVYYFETATGELTQIAETENEVQSLLEF